MIYTLSIDWLSLFCIYSGETDTWNPAIGGPFDYKTETFGTRSFSRFTRVRIANEEGGWDDFAEIQSEPYSSILPPWAMIIRFTNRTLYLPNFWELADDFLTRNLIGVQGISRIDICADFNQFAAISPQALIEGFAAKTLRHIGRGVGALYFNHQVINKQYGVNYTGLSFGTHSSDAHVYLYNKSFELLTQGDKPWIRDTWKNVGLDVRNVWRLEVSIKRSGLKFRDKKSGSNVHIDVDKIYEPTSLAKIYHTFVKKLFAFIVNKKDISNITREPRIMLFEDEPAYDRGVIRNLSAGNRMEKILIRSLHQLADRYRGTFIARADEQAKDLARLLANATDLRDWYYNEQDQWEKPIHK